ncbi:MAG: J domain-containing protein [Coriobacteriia bacterium]
MAKDHYRTLQVTRDADPEVIEKAFKVLARRYHPDTSEDAPDRAHRRMQALNQAYAVLRDPVLRAGYDATLPGTGGRRSGWEVFWDSGLVGLYQDRRRHME